MSKLIIFLSLSVFFPANLCVAQGEMGARLTAMGNNGSAVSDIWSLSANPSGITSSTTPVLAAHYANYVFDNELSRQAITYIQPLDENFIGIGVQRYGISVFNEIQARIGYAKKFGPQLSIGITMNYHQIQIKNYGTSTGFSVNAGLMYSPFKELILGLYIDNPANQQYRHQHLQQSIPKALYIGTAYQASDQLLIATTVTKQANTAVTFGFGLDYRPFKPISLRSGLNMNPFRQQVGIGINHKKLVLDMAVENDKQLGYLPQIAIAYAF